MPKISNFKDNCCGCAACAAKCPRKCICMVEDAYGFLNPKINLEACVECGKCDAVCPLLNKREQTEPLEVCWAKSNDKKMLMSSSSGGIFSILAHDVLVKGGVICGATWDSDCKGVHHTLVESEEGLEALMRSKYVQSKIESEVYVRIKDAIRSDRRVLFVGTACQVAGVRSYLGKLADLEGFLAVDVICHGVPSPLLWRKWANFRERSAESHLIGVNMRSKKTGWASYSVVYEFESGLDTSPFYCDWYYKAFLNNISLRPSCFACSAKCSSGSDVTLGDFWGIQTAHPEVNFEGGVSAVLCNTEKGKMAVEAVRDRMKWGESSLEKVVSSNPSLQRSVSVHPSRNAFMAELSNGASIESLMQTFSFKSSLLNRLLTKCKKLKATIS